MKLELKHLAPYLPYRLEVMDSDNNIDMCIGIKYWLGWDVVCDYEWGHSTKPLSSVKPILRPLSDLTKEIEHNGERFVPIDELRYTYSGFYIEFNGSLLIKSKNTHIYISIDWPNAIKEKLLEWHFDVFGLINEGLAIAKEPI